MEGFARDALPPDVLPPQSTVHDGTTTALQALEQLSLQSQHQTPDKRARSPQRPPSSRKATGSNVPSAAATGRRTSSSSLTTPSLQKRLSSAGSVSQSSPAASPHLGPRRGSATAVRPSSSSSSSNAAAGAISALAGLTLAQAQLQPQQRTAASYAREVLEKELGEHEAGTVQSETVVILHEACYGHRFSRPRTGKAALGMIVERPERITAVVLGVAAGFVRLGGRWDGDGGRGFARREGSVSGAGLPEELREVKLEDGEDGKGLPFTIRRSSRSVGLLSEAVVAVHGKDWMEELQAMCRAAGARLAIDGRELVRIRRDDANGKPAKELHEGDLYLCAESLDALQGAVGGVCDAVDAVFNDTLTKRAFVAVRPPGHHCSADYPSGFCWLNNAHVGIQYAAQTHGLTHAVILDFDLHHGDGSQDIAWERNERSAACPKTWPHSKKPLIGYYSLHDINSFPCEMGDRSKVQAASLCLDAHSQSVWNVHLETWHSEDDFGKLYESKYSIIFDKARAFLQRETKRISASPKGGRPKAAIFISAGFDASQWEGAGMQRHGVHVPTSFYERFTQDAVKLAQEDLTGAEGRVISVLEGGYSNRALTSGALSHIAGLTHPRSFAGPHDSAGRSAASQWWNSAALAELDAYESIEPAAPKKVRNGYMNSFASPTESSMQRAVDPERFYRSMSGTMRPLPEMAPDLTIPDVSWVVASHALCKLLVPSHRTTTSCRPEDLAAPKIKKARDSVGTVPPEPMSAGRQLRDRKKPADVMSEDESASRPRAVSRTNRRRTMADVSTDDGLEKPPVQPKRASRRSSAASSVDLGIRISDPVPAVPAIPQAFSQIPMAQQAAKQANIKKPRNSPSKPSGLRELANGAPLGTSAQSGPVSTPPSLTTESSTASYETAPSSAGDMDSLTSAVKRITLKVGSREEHDRRVREQQEAEDAAVADARRKPRKLAAAKTKQFAGPSTISLPAATPAAVQAPTFRPAGVANGIIPSKPPSTSRTPLTQQNTGKNIQAAPPAPIAAAVADDTAKAHAAVSIPPRSDSLQASATASDPMDIAAVLNPVKTPTQKSYDAQHQQEQQQYQTTSRTPSRPGSSGVRPGSRGQNQGAGALPTFSSTGAIPFASAPNSVMGLQADAVAFDGEWEVGRGGGNGVSKSMLSEEEVLHSVSGGDEGEGPEIQETPAR